MSSFELCDVELRNICAPCMENAGLISSSYNCSLPGLQGLTPGQYEGITANYLSSVTNVSSPNFPIRAEEFRACTGGRIIFSEATNVWEDPVIDLGTKTTRGAELYDGYFMSYSLFPEVSALGLAETLNDRIREDNDRLKWEDIFPQVRRMGEYRRNGATDIDFLMYDGDFFVPVVRLDLLEKFNLPLPNTWDEVVETAMFFDGKDLNDDGNTNDFGFCHFPRSGQGSWDQWWPESVYSTWASFEQTKGTRQGFIFDKDTMEPRLGSGFLRATTIWKQLWNVGEGDCGDPNFAQGRCAIGYAPPGCLKTLFLNGVSRRDENNTIIWQPTMKNGDYAEPYRFKPFGSLDVIDPSTGEFVPCTPEICPQAETVPRRGHYSDDDRAKDLPPSPHAGKLINRVPLYWSGGLGTLIRKSSPLIKKNLMWDFFVYTNSPETSVNDVARYSSWLDSWRYSQLTPGDNFIRGGWSEVAYNEHSALMQWAFSNEANGAFNMRIPGVISYTRDVAGAHLMRYFNNEQALEDAVQEIIAGWNSITAARGKLDQLATYRASLGLDEHSEVELCRLHRSLMDNRDPSICRKYDADPTAVKRKQAGDDWIIKKKELIMDEPPCVLGRGSFGEIFLAEYRGTQVAVKRAILPKAASLSTSSLISDCSENYGYRTRHMRSALASGMNSSMICGAKENITANRVRNDIESGARLQIDGGPQDVQLRNSRSAQKRDSPNIPTGDRVLVDFALESKIRKDFILEMKRLAKLRHPCITTLMGGVLEKNEEPLLVMEYMELGSLRDLLRNQSIHIGGEIILPILRDIVQGVRFLHAATPQIVHSDLKASNVLVDSRYRAKVADFGLSQNNNNIGVGTPFWMAPEVLRQETPNTPASDCYAFGILLHEVYSRKDPYDGEDPTEVLRGVADYTVNKRPSCPSDCPPKVELLMADCLGADPESRPTFEELDLQLKRLDVSMIEPVIQTDSKRAHTDTQLDKSLPKCLANELHDGRGVQPFCCNNVTVFFSDIECYSELCSSLAPMQVAELLNCLFTQMDKLSLQYGLTKIETMNDSYMAVANLDEGQSLDHAHRIAQFALAAVSVANNTLTDTSDPSRGQLKLRAGFASGPVVAHVVGSLNPRVASCMKATSIANQILCSEASAELLRKQCPDLVMLTNVGSVSVKGKDDVPSYCVEGRNMVHILDSSNHNAIFDSMGERVQ
eukprot:scaffold42408_cov176-Amphora_coffeaeformis.AAC.1